MSNMGTENSFFSLLQPGTDLHHQTFCLAAELKVSSNSSQHSTSIFCGDTQVSLVNPQHTSKLTSQFFSLYFQYVLPCVLKALENKMVWFKRMIQSEIIIHSCNGWASPCCALSELSSLEFPLTHRITSALLPMLSHCRQNWIGEAVLMETHKSHWSRNNFFFPGAAPKYFYKFCFSVTGYFIYCGLSNASERFLFKHDVFTLSVCLFAERAFYPASPEGGNWFKENPEQDIV